MEGQWSALPHDNSDSLYVRAGEKPGATASSAVVEQIFTCQPSVAVAQVVTASSSVDIGATLIPLAPNNATIPLEHTGKAPMDKTALIEHLVDFSGTMVMSGATNLPDVDEPEVCSSGTQRC